ncbi:uncharacterized protein LOC135560118 isoform X2 [Oncorhynchus nerka]|uniref:uncharacterized protein LOC135560118 isoform X2 n=1 Tax=Oncorhynchus nerka TaxID=8023 RepID=UPI0031B84314
MPYRLWTFKFVCAQPQCAQPQCAQPQCTQPQCTQPQCKRQNLTGCGVYKTVRRVLDMDGWYYMGTEYSYRGWYYMGTEYSYRGWYYMGTEYSYRGWYYMGTEYSYRGWYYMGTEYLECRLCKKLLAGWSLEVLNQLDTSHRSMFPAILTYRLSCDLKVVTPPPFLDVPSAQWLLTVHGYDVLFQLEDFKARVTSIFGSILKMDSTKKEQVRVPSQAYLLEGLVGWNEDRAEAALSGLPP